MRDDLELLTTAEAAQLLKCREQTLRKQRIDGRGPRFIRMGDGPNARVCYRLSDIRTWLDRRVRRSTAEDRAAAAIESVRSDLATEQ
jgi:hypothetical protein